MASADRLVGGPLCFPFLGAVTGLVVAPAAGAVTSLRVLAPNASGGPSWLPLGGAAVLTAALAESGVASALAGVSLLLAGLMTGYLAAGAVQVRMVTDLT